MVPKQGIAKFRQSIVVKAVVKVMSRQVRILRLIAARTSEVRDTK